MRKLSLAIIFAYCTLALAAQDVIKVKYQGAMFTISDFARVFLTAVENDEEKMTYCDPPGFDVDYYETTYALPRVGRISFSPSGARMALSRRRH